MVKSAVANPDSQIPIPGRHNVTATIPYRAAALVLDAFLDYNVRFSDITRRAKRRFERRDWKYVRIDAAARIDLYDVCVRETLGRLELLLEERVRSRSIWAQIRNQLDVLVAPMLDHEFPKTFFNSLSRRFFHTKGVANDIEFVALDSEPTEGIADATDLNSYSAADGLAIVCKRILDDYPFANAYADIAGCVKSIARRLGTRMRAIGVKRADSIDLIKSAFFRERRAYLIGRISSSQGDMPLARISPVATSFPVICC